jgi:hypothetical protein
MKLFVNTMVGVCFGFALCMLVQSVVYPAVDSGCKVPVVKQVNVPTAVDFEIVPLDVDSGTDVKQLIIPIVEGM